jgi:transposase
LSRGDLSDTEWRILSPLLPDRGERGPRIPDKRRTVNGILRVLRTGEQHRGTLGQRPRYGASLVEAYRQAGIYAGKVFKPIFYTSIY